MLMAWISIITALVVSIGGLILGRFVKLPTPVKVLLWLVFWLGVIYLGIYAYMIGTYSEMD